MTKSIIATGTNLICWIPSSAILVMTLIWEQFPYKILVWATTIVLPLNSIINPFVLTHAKLICKIVSHVKKTSLASPANISADKISASPVNATVSTSAASTSAVNTSVVNTSAANTLIVIN